ncbi:tRNA (adenosine(37)-N6)-dimethylallyltransferase MiaA [Siphonobacter sp. BAB-5385]|uniref:tRNA (adenosine(37)-N6)-dimethylallyltransferase MiaA n=1 Tax=Siphonobacter sp. BAB-5385 TaxID=1864822 RepID=UPI000B9E9FF0|nr:tRNA (adenosine(37)-N6)-dimethylallyltransferase MiaA [Siphonobacter sp. BAB-5385]OZI08496.1 tRNA (adenosine(37)-N6)-dimethylallyltransferase MiaA [Siphonobacter sp. BAB-5385]
MHTPIVVLGPTASGKTRLAVALATEFEGEIISVDSRQVYRTMDIGTGKDLSEYGTIPYHLIDIIEAGKAYNLYEFQKDFKVVYDEMQSRNKRPILCGGTGLYLEAVLKNHAFTAIPNNPELREQLSTKSDEALREHFQQLDSPYHAVADLSTRKRTLRAIEIATYLQQFPFAISIEKPALNPLVLGLNPPVEIRRERITKRLHERLQNGMIEEVQGLLDQGIAADQLIYYGLEYKFITEYLSGVWAYETMVERLNVAIHQYAKRQMTFFRKMERDGLRIHWLTGSFEEQLLQARQWVEEKKNWID